ncbi:MAG TPA: VCBS repeat-containing protein [Candidatus Limnocylindrales bacterium]|nr:VCBS repeat-containing protein [Candidatus Limnocylindrales bacterium]
MDLMRATRARRTVTRHARWARLTAAILAAALIGLVPGPAASPRPALAATACIGPWQAIDFPPALSAMEPQAAASLNGKPAWVVGLSSARLAKRRPMIGAWTGTGWRDVAVPWTSYAVLRAIEASSASNAWTVGSIGTYTRWPIAGRWNGTSWKAIKVPRPSGQLATFVDLAMVSPSSIWAVGTRLQKGLFKPLAMRRASGSWRTSSPSLPAGAEGSLTDVTRAPNGKIWAAGWRTGADGEARAWIVSRTTSGWQEASVSGVPSGRAAILDVAFRTASDGVAVGFVDRAGGYLPLLLRWNGSAWSAESLPWEDRSIILTSAQIAANGQLTLSGMELDVMRRDILAVSGSSGWTINSISPGTPNRAQMMGTAALSAGAVAVGYLEDRPISAITCPGGASSAGRSVTGERQRPTAHGPADHPDHDESRVDIQAQRPIRDTLSVRPQSIAGVTALDKTADAGLSAINYPTWGGVVADFNGDTHDDLYVGLHFQQAPQIMLNSPTGVFSPLAGSLSKHDRHRCSAADVNADSTVDLYCTIGVNKGTSNTPNELLLSPGAGGGTIATRQRGVLDGYGRGRDAIFLNLDGDAYPDLYVINEPSRSDGMWSSNRLYRNVGGTHFEAAASWGVDHSMGGLCAKAADLDGDADDELLLCTGEPYGTLTQGLRVFMNEDGRFVDRTAALGISPFFDRDVEVADFNGDGLMDIAQLSGKLLRVSLRTAGGSYVNAFELPLTAAVAMAVGDVSGDGRPDIYIARRTVGNAGHLMLVNNGSATGFTSVAIPQPGAGNADDVLAIDWDHNGRMDFVTINGWNRAGPVKLTAFYP